MLVVDGQPPGASIQSFRTYPVRKMIDVTVAAMAVQQEDLFPGLNPLRRCQLSTIISELGTNIVKYAGSGRILLRSLETADTAGIEVLAIDTGPGISDVGQALQDHFSSGKSLGLGLGSVQRLATEFELQCPDSGGTRVRAVCWWPRGRASAPFPPTHRDPTEPLTILQRRGRDHLGSTNSGVPQSPLHFTSLSRNRPALGQAVSGDALIELDHGSLSFRIVLDGAGHGPIAHQLSSRAAELIRAFLREQIKAFPPSDEGCIPISPAGLDSLMLETANATHAQTRSSRGVAFGMAVFDGQAHQLHYLGIGNTRILKLNWKGWEGVNRDGQLGVSFKRPQVNHYPLSPGDLVVQSSDGIRTERLRHLRANRPDSRLKPEPILNELLSSTSFNDDVSILLTQCHA